MSDYSLLCSMYHIFNDNVTHIKSEQTQKVKEKFHFYGKVNLVLIVSA